MLLTNVVKTGVFQIQYEEWHSLPETKKTMANAFIWWAAKTRIKAKFNKVAGNMGSGMNYGMNAAGQMQPADKKSIRCPR